MQGMPEGCPDLPLAGRFLCQFLRATEEELGVFSLRIIMQKCAEFDGSLPAAAEMKVDPSIWAKDHSISTSQFAALQREIRSFYGMAARRVLNRIGRNLWQRMVKEATLPDRSALLGMRLGPLPNRQLKTIEFLIGHLPDANPPITVRLEGRDLWFEDPSSPSSFGQSTDEPICWLIQGLIQDALHWGTGVEPEVQEVACRAMGAPACLFHIYH